MPGMRRAAAFLVSVALLAGCHAPRFSRAERVVSSRFYTIRTDVGQEIEKDVAPALDRIAERLIARLGDGAAPPESPFAAVIFSRSEDFERFRAVHGGRGEGVVGFYCRYGNEIAFALSAVEAAALRESVPKRFGGEVAESSELARQYNEVLQSLHELLAKQEPLARAQDLHTIVHEMTHQILAAYGRDGLPHWLSEGYAELEAHRAVEPEDLPAAARRYWLGLRRLRELRASLVLAVRALYGCEVLADPMDPWLREVGWDGDAYAAHLGLCACLAERAPDALEALIRGGPVPHGYRKGYGVALPELGGWARLDASRRLAGMRDPAAQAILGVLWDVERPEREAAAAWAARFAEEEARLSSRKAGPSSGGARSLALFGRRAFGRDVDAALARTRAVLEPAVKDLLRSILETREFAFDEFEGHARSVWEALPKRPGG